MIHIILYLNSKRWHEGNSRLRKKNGKLLKKIQILKDKNNQKDSKYIYHLYILQNQSKEKSQECENIDEKVKVIFTSGQINKIKMK